MNEATQEFETHTLPNPRGVDGSWEKFMREEEDGEVVAGMRFRGAPPYKFLVHEGCAHLLFPIDKPVLHPDNPRRGDLPTIRESLLDHGQFDNVIVNRGTYSKKYDPWTAATGNHTLTAARELDWTHIGVQIIDVDDDELDRIALVHNAASDRAYYDEGQLVGVTRRLGSLEGTGIDSGWLRKVRARQENAHQRARGEKGDKPKTNHECPNCGYSW